MQYICISVIIATFARPSTQVHINLIDELTRDGGKWMLAAASTNADDAPPPSRTCIEVTISNTFREFNCLFNNHNHTIRNIQMLRIIGIDGENNTEVFTEGPVHQWLDPALNSSVNTLSLNAMVKSSICWAKNTIKFKSYSFTAAAIAYDYVISKDKTQKFFILLVGVNCRWPTIEIHTGLLVKRTLNSFIVSNMVEIVERMFRNQFPPLSIKCADDFIPDEAIFITKPFFG